MARVRTVSKTPMVGKVKSTGYGRTTYRMRRPKSIGRIGRYEEPQLMPYGRTFLQEDYGCPDVKSTAVESIGYNNSANRLTVTYRGGRPYAYYGVSRQEYQAFCTSESKGRYVNRNIKGSHAYQRLG